MKHSIHPKSIIHLVYSISTEVVSLCVYLHIRLLMHNATAHYSQSFSNLIGAVSFYIEVASATPTALDILLMWTVC